MSFFNNFFAKKVDLPLASPPEMIAIGQKEKETLHFILHELVKKEPEHLGEHALPTAGVFLAVMKKPDERMALAFRALADLVFQSHNVYAGRGREIPELPFPAQKKDDRKYIVHLRSLLKSVHVYEAERLALREEVFVDGYKLTPTNHSSRPTRFFQGTNTRYVLFAKDMLAVAKNVLGVEEEVGRTSHRQLLKAGLQLLAPQR